MHSLALVIALTFPGEHDTRVPALLALPKQAKGPVPLVVLLDGVEGGKDRWFQESSWPGGVAVVKALLEAGFAVFTLDPRLHGARAAEAKTGIPTSWAERRPFVLESITELRRAVTSVCERKELDCARVHVLGLSMGAMMGLALASTEPRVASLVVGLTPVGRVKGPDLADIAPLTFALRVTAPTLALFGTRDAFSPRTDVEPFFGALAAQQKELWWAETDHAPPKGYEARVVQWFLGHSAAR